MFNVLTKIYEFRSQKTVSVVYLLRLHIIAISITRLLYDYIVFALIKTNYY